MLCEASCFDWLSVGAVVRHGPIDARTTNQTVRSKLLRVANLSVGAVVRHGPSDAKRSRCSRVVSLLSRARIGSQNRYLDAFKSTFGGSKIDLWRPPNRAKIAWGVKKRFKSAQERPESAQERPKKAQERPRSPPRAPEERPRAPQWPLKSAPMATQESSEMYWRALGASF